MYKSGRRRQETSAALGDAQSCSYLAASRKWPAEAPRGPSQPYGKEWEEEGGCSCCRPGWHRQGAAAARARGASLTHAGHAGHVQLEAVEAVAGVSLRDAHAAPVLAAVEDPALLRLQPLEALVETWRVARWGQSRVSLSPTTKGISGMQQDSGDARADSQESGAELAPSLEQPGQGGN